MTVSEPNIINGKRKLQRMNKYDKNKYKKDFPDEGYFNWKTVMIRTPKNVYYDGARITGVVLHDGNFMVNGVLFLKKQFTIIDEDPLDLKNDPLPPLDNFAIEQFKGIVDKAKRINSGNASHHARAIEGDAKRAIEFITKHYNKH